MAEEESDTSSGASVAASSATQSLVRGLSVIRVFGAGRSALKVSEVATHANVTRATARRILLTLQELGYVTEHESRFSLSPKILDLGYAYLSSLELSDLIEPAMARLAARVDHPCSASVLDVDDIVIVQILQGPTVRTTDDTQNGIKVGPDGFRGRVFAIGPHVMLPLGHGFAMLKWHHEMGALYRPEGNKFDLKMLVPL